MAFVTAVLQGAWCGLNLLPFTCGRWPEHLCAIDGASDGGLPPCSSTTVTANATAVTDQGTEVTHTVTQVTKAHCNSSGLSCSEPDKVGDALRRYQFYLAFENTCEQGYVTEKVYNALDAGIVPVYLGAPDLDIYVPKGSVIGKHRWGKQPEKNMQATAKL